MDKICCPVSRQLVTSHQPSVKRYSKIVCEQFNIHHMVERMEAADKMTRYCGHLSPRWLRAMIIKLYKQITEIRVHEKKNCRKVLRPESNYSPTIQIWYDRIHACQQLIRMKEKNAKNIGNILRFARQQNIEHPEQLTMEELKDGIQVVRI
jgi:hypothetical protein